MSTKEYPDNSIIGGFVRTDGGKVKPQVEGRRPDELSKIDVDARDERLEKLASMNKKPDGRRNNKGWPKGKVRTRKSKLAVMGIPKEILVDGNPAYARCVKLAQAYKNTRIREMAISHGFVSSGVSALLAAASLAIASSRYLYQVSVGIDPAIDRAGFLQTVKAASQLCDSARQNELAAWELCAREGTAKRKSASVNQASPWVIPEEKKPGRKRNDDKVIDNLALPPIGGNLEAWVAGDSLVVEEANGQGTVISGPAEGSREGVVGLEEQVGLDGEKPGGV